MPESGIHLPGRRQQHLDRWPAVWLAWNDWLLYGTGGYANGNIKARSFVTATGAVFDDFGARHGGWFLGGGLEYAIWKGSAFDAIIGVEYQHIDLGTARLLSPADGGVFALDTRDIGTTANLILATLSLKGNFFH
jgi:opacity protein-like surface antigen